MLKQIQMAGRRGIVGLLTPIVLTAICFGVFVAGVTAADTGFESIFDGKTLKNWDGNPKFWSVQDGAITGRTTKATTTQGNTFIVWKGGSLGDFELKLQYKIVGGNSGIQYRSFRLPGKNDGWRIGGYQADFEAGDTYSGIVYGERFRGILCNRGLQTELIREGGKFQVKTIRRLGASKAIQSKIKKEDWNDYHITAKGFRLIHRINGVVTADCTDSDAKERRASGLLALQLHAGPPMVVQFRNIRVKRLVKTTSFFSPSLPSLPSLPALPSLGTLSDVPSAGVVADRVAEEAGGFTTEVIRLYLGLPFDVRDAVIEKPEQRTLPPTTEVGGVIRTIRSKRAAGLRYLAIPLRSVVQATVQGAEEPQKKSAPKSR
jgi:hypothetical protein